jgi:hypothetical protein
LRESGSGQEVRADGLGSVNPLPSKGGCGESTRICPRNLFAMLSAEYAGGGQRCESDHLEPFLFVNPPIGPGVPSGPLIDFSL